MIEGFDPNFDDAIWTMDWADLPLAQIPPGNYADGYRVARQLMREIGIFGQAYQFENPVDVRALYDPEGLLWMSDTPQERMMMVNNAAQTSGHVLVGGMGLGLYPQYCFEVESCTIVEQSPVIADLVGPLLAEVMEERGVPLDIITADVEVYLRDAKLGRFDTIFLDTWSQIDAAQLPMINSLRELAWRHLAPGGRILLWGYRWMVRLFQEACAAILLTPPEERDGYVTEWLQNAPRAAALLEPVAEAYAGQVIQRWELDGVVAELGEWVVGVVEE